MYSKILWTLVLATLVALIVWLNTGDDPAAVDWGSAAGDRPDAVERRTEAEPVRATAVQGAADRGQSAVDAAPAPQGASADMVIPEPSPYEVDDLLRWYEERGRVVGLSDYQDYPPETLNALAEQGDIHALQLVAEQLFEQGQHELANSYLFEAAARGSLHALELTSRAHYREMLSARRDGDSEAEKQSAMEALAWYETAYLRGDLNARSRVDGLLQSLGELELSEEDLNSIQLKARDNYQQLAGRRGHLGFPEFDDTPHPVLKRYFDLYEAQSPRD